ncbi:MAG: hypothetical protein QM756_45305 [Polyangiaceae bacterium]
MKTWHSLAFTFALTAFPCVAVAEPGFARPPDEPLVPEDQVEVRSEPRYMPESSWLRVYAGPALRLSEAATDGGLYAAFDVGRRATGLRVAGAWMRAGSDQGVSAYTGELWIDFGVGRVVHPVVAAGAGLARVGSQAADGEARTASVGVGVLRGSLDYVLPVASEDARLGVDLIGNVPAIRGAEASDVKPWLLAVARVGIGF